VKKLRVWGSNIDLLAGIAIKQQIEKIDVLRLESCNLTNEVLHEICEAVRTKPIPVSFFA